MKPDALGRDGEANAEVLIEMLRRLPESIPEIRAFEAGKNVIDSPAAWDVALFSSFADTAALEQYRIHPEHQKVIQFVNETTSDRAVVDYESAEL